MSDIRTQGAERNRMLEEFQALSRAILDATDHGEDPVKIQELQDASERIWRSYVQTYQREHAQEFQP
jgi:hypothetical protein